MWIKNNSKREWIGFDTGIQKVDIKSEGVFEVPNKVGDVLLKLLGCKSWLQETVAPKKKKKVNDDVIISKHKTNKKIK